MTREVCPCCCRKLEYSLLRQVPGPGPDPLPHQVRGLGRPSASVPCSIDVPRPEAAVTRGGHTPTLLLVLAVAVCEGNSWGPGVTQWMDYSPSRQASFRDYSLSESSLENL